MPDKIVRPPSSNPVYPVILVPESINPERVIIKFPLRIHINLQRMFLNLTSYLTIALRVPQDNRPLKAASSGPELKLGISELDEVTYEASCEFH